MSAGMDAERKIKKARMLLIRSQPFFASLALRLRVRKMNDAEIMLYQTCGTNGIDLAYNPEFIDKLSLPQTAGLWSHEVMHNAVGHTFRLGSRDARKFNLAADFAIDPIIAEAGLELPAGAHIKAEWKGKSAEAIYDLIPAPPAQQAFGFGAIMPPGEGEGERPLSPSQMKQLEEEWKIATVQAANFAQQYGKLPASLQRLVGELTEPKLDWRSLLREFFRTLTPNDYSWAPPSRRYIGQGLYMPGLRSERLGPIGVFIDTSGSVWSCIEEFAAEFNAILGEARPEKVVLIYCDADIQAVEEYEPCDWPVQITARGGGGTDFRPPFEWIADNGIDLSAAVYLTDMYGGFPDDQPPYPVLWCSNGGDTAPFGQVVKL